MKYLTTLEVAHEMKVSKQTLSTGSTPARSRSLLATPRATVCGARPG